MGITGKVNSMISVAKACDTHIIALAETKLGKTAPAIPGYSWYNKHKKLGSGGVALLIRDDIKHMCKQVNDLEDQDQEILWCELSSHNQKTFIGVFYGPQEKCSHEEADRQFSQITSQVNKLKKKGEIVLMGDFNAKLEINKPGITQKQSRNGELMKKMVESTQMSVRSLETELGNWTRVKRKGTAERSIIDYVVMTPVTSKSTTYLEIDEGGSHRLKGKEDSDHNTFIIEVTIPTTKKVEKITTYNMKNKKKWGKNQRETT